MYLDGWEFLDWKNQANPDATKAGVHALLVLALRAGADLLSALGENGTAAAVKEAAERAERYVPDPRNSKQAAAILSLAGLLGKGTAADLIARDGAKDFSTFFGYYLLRAETEGGRLDAALDAIREYWGGMLSLGATTFWEDFDLAWTEGGAAPITDPVPEGANDIHGDHGDHCYRGFRHSLCHGWSSGPCPFLSEYVLGVRCVSHDVYRIAPDLGGLSFAKGTVPTRRGVITVSVTAGKDAKPVVRATAPEGIRLLFGA